MAVKSGEVLLPGTCRVAHVQAGQQGVAEGGEAVPEHDVHGGDGLGVAQAQRGQRGEVAVEQGLVVGVDAAEGAGVGVGVGVEGGGWRACGT